MNFKVPLVAAVGVLLIAGGCTSMPSIESPDRQAATALSVGEPFQYMTEGEPLDVVDSHQTLSIEQSVKLALQHDPRIQASLAKLRQAEAEARQTRLLPNPVIGIAFRFPDGGGKSIIDADVAADLLSLLSRPGRISAADNRLRKASAETLIAVLDVVRETQQQFVDLQSLRDQLDVESSRRQILQQLVSVTDSRVNAGEAGRLDVLTVQAELSALEGELISLRSQERLARLTLARLIGQPSRTQDWELTRVPAPAPTSVNEQEWILRALEHRPEIAAVKWELEALGQGVRIARLGVLTGDVGVAAERDDGWSIGPSASLAIPIFDTGQAAKDSRVAAVVEQRHELTRASRQVVEDVRRALEKVRSASDAMDLVNNQLLPLQEQRLKQSQDAYRLGLSDILMLRLAEQEAQEAKARLIVLRGELLQANFDLDRAVGGRGFAVAAKLPSTQSSDTTTKESIK